MVLAPQITHRREQLRATVPAPLTAWALSSEISGTPLSFYQGLYLFKALYGVEMHCPFSGTSVLGNIILMTLAMIFPLWILF